MLQRSSVAAGLVFLALVVASVSEARDDRVVIGSTPSGHLMWIADALGYFEDAGVDVEMQAFSSGVTASDALIAGKIDLANSSEFAFVNNVARAPNLRIVAGISRARSVQLFARRDRAIMEAADLVGRRIGVTRGGIAEFFLGEYLAIHGIALTEVSLVDLRAPAIEGEIAAGTVDAAITWEPFVLNSRKTLGENFYALPGQDSYFYHFLLVGMQPWITRNSTSLQSVLRALLRAEAFVADNPERAQRLIAERLGLDRDIVDAIWPKFILEVTLMQTLLGLMEQEARWLIENGLVDPPAIPNFLDVIDPAPLSAVAPDAVQLIR